MALRMSVCLAALTQASEMVKHKPKPMRTYTADSEPPKRCGIQNVPHDPAQGTRVALALFGLVRNNATALNFERFLLAPLLDDTKEKYTIDVVLHANVASRITNARSGEALQKLPGYGAWRRFAPCRWTLEDQDALDARLQKFKRQVMKVTSDTYHDDGQSIMNLLRALHSLRESGRLVEAREHATGLRFDVVASVRVDTIFTREVPAPVFAFAKKSPVAKIFVPHFGCSINGDLVLNDRFALGQRQEMLYVYLNRIETLITYHVNKSETRHVGISGERHLLNAVSDKHIPVARLFEFCLRRVRAGGRIWYKLFVSQDGHTCPLEETDQCDQACMLAQPRCEAGRGCRQRGQHYAARFFDGYDWCDNKKTPDYVCRYDTVRLGFSEAGKKPPGPPPGAAGGKTMPPRGRARGWRAAAAAKTRKGEM